MSGHYENKTRRVYANSESDLEFLLMIMGVEEDEIRRVVVHERDHYNSAMKLGYSPRYGLIISTDSFERITSIKGLVEVSGVTLDNAIEIALAPKEPSPVDLDIAKRARKKLEEGADQ